MYDDPSAAFPQRGRRTKSGFASLIESARAWFLRILAIGARQTAGLALLLIALGGALALATFDPADASFSTATGTAPSNILGGFGAYFADAALQSFGLAAAFLFFAAGVWGARLLALKSEARWRLRLVALPFCLLAVALAASLFAAPSLWPLHVGLGGAVGDLLSALLVALLATAGIAWTPLIAAFFLVLFLALALFLTALACGLRARHFAFALRLFEKALARLPKLGRRRPRVAVQPPFAGFEDGGDGGVIGAVVPERVVPAGAGPRPGELRIARLRRPQKAGKRAAQEAQASLDLDSALGYQLPPLNLLAKLRVTGEAVRESDDALEQNARLLESVLADFGVRGLISEVRPGPVVALYELEPAAGIKASRVIGLADDIARSMSALSCRVAVVPGRNVIGVELPNRRRETVYLRELLSSPEYEATQGDLTLALGKDISGAPVLADLARMPHLLIAGTTGSGKSVAINTMILSLLYRLSPSQCRLILIDPKMLELSMYDDIPHLLAPVVTEPKKAIAALKWVVREMEDRYRRMSKLGVRNIAGYNERVSRAIRNKEVLKRRVQTGFDRETGEPVYEDEIMDFAPMPFIVVVVDEMADLMLMAGKDIEGLVQRLAQMARAAGIHLVMATQRPSVDVITGTIKANFPTRISFQVTSKIDSRTILGEQGAEQLLGQGDMLYMAGGGRIRRVHGPFVSDEEVEAVVHFLKKQGRPEYLDAVTAVPDEDEDGAYGLGDPGEDGGDELYRQALDVVIGERKATTSYIQRRLQIGYNRAARLIERMEEEGVLSAPNHLGKREILRD